MAYVTPKVQIQQEFTQIPVYSEFPLPAFIIGPNYSLRRYNVQAEKQLTALVHPTDYSLANSYQPTTDVTYEFSNIPAGGNVDPTYTQLFAEAVEAVYFPNAALGSTAVNAALELVQAPSGQNYPNRLRFVDADLVTANGYARSAYLSGRDVKIGDKLSVTDNLGNTLNSTIKGIFADTAVEDPTLASTIGVALAAHADGVAVLNSPVFTSAAGSFSQAMVGQSLTIASKGTYKILAVASANSVALDTALSFSGTGLGYHVGGVYNDLGNTAVQAEAVSATPSYVWAGTGADAGTAGVTIANASTAYKGYGASRILSDIYTATVTTAGTNLTNVRFSVASNAGAFTTLSNQALAAGVLTLDNDNGNAVALDFSDTVDGSFKVGQSWTLAVTAPVALVNPTTAGSYLGPVDMVYKLTVARGGAFLASDKSNSSTCAQIAITSSDLDSSASMLVSASTAFRVGNYGVTATFATGSNNGGLLAGDVYYITVKAAQLGRVKVVEISDNLSSSMLSVATAWTGALALVQASVEIPALRDIVSGTLNWSQEANSITVNSAVTTYDNSLVALGTPVRLPVANALLFAQHRDLLQNNINSISSIRTPGAVEALLGTVHPDNALAQGVYDASLNSANQLVYFIGVATDDLAGYQSAIEIAKKSDKVYGFVPLTFDKAVHEAVVSHVMAYSTPEVGRWRVSWLAAQDTLSAPIYDLKASGSAYTGTVTDNPRVTGTQYNLVTIVGAQFITDGVRPNDKVRLNFRLDPNSNVIYDEYTVDAVHTEETLTLTTKLAAAINSPVKMNVIRVYTKDERAQNIATLGGSYKNRRVRVVFPDTYKSNGVSKSGYFLAAAFAGLRSSVVPHQGLTYTTFLGADDLTKVVETFTQDQLNVMAEQGIWIAMQDVVGAVPYVRHQLTADQSGLNTSEDSITTNVDSISYALMRVLSPYIGKYNVNPENLAVVRGAIVSELNFFATGTWTVTAGNQLVSFTAATDLLLLQIDPTFKDRMNVQVRLNVPYPLNYLNLTLIV